MTISELDQRLVFLFPELVFGDIISFSEPQPRMKVIGIRFDDPSYKKQTRK